MPLEVSPELLDELGSILSKMVDPVKVIFFSDNETKCELCNDTREVLSLLRDISYGKVVVEEYEVGSEAARGVERSPVLVLRGKNRGSVRFIGSPLGYEFGTLVEDLIDLSTGKISITSGVAEALEASVWRPVRVMVFVTHDCPYCPIAVRASHKLAMVNNKIIGDMVSALENPDLTKLYEITAVPTIIVQAGGVELGHVGTLREKELASLVLQALEKAKKG